ncbi:acyl-CoA dehydrogenase family protein [Sinimarinibacterium sp. NLF-5-8]|uniref:acyl-CoA dehydrogenase family protein n=1 Tax=Sinimarinibacterium sp. NLF-5-8 TaxID=2698684 RepID=UPI00137C37B6|nr:acyl-CoA dehydrogenase family protein [Sinimarinibacterium sp. NLF-5-8]QHS09464.1 acyl-CoA dehydrogenase [Sinimarinibacterium sp. NLF-5-8]
MQRRAVDPDLEMFRDSARKFFQTEIRPHRERWRETGVIDRAAFLKAGEAGYLCMWADEAYGGLGLKDFRYEQILIEENAAHGDSGYFITLHSRLVAPYLENFGSEAQKAQFLPDLISGRKILAIAMTEPDAGSDLAGMKARAVEHEDHWLLNGAKTYISNGINADVVIVAAKTHAENPHGVTLFIVERGMPGFERGRLLKKMGMKSQDTAELFFQDVRIPKTHVLGQVHAGFYHLMQGLAEERLIAACGNVAAARVALQVTQAFVRNRKVFGKPLSKMQNTRFKLAALEAELDIAQVYVDRCVEQHNLGKLDAVDAARAKLFTSELNARMVDEGVQQHGGAGYMEEYEICRLYEDERIHRILAGTSEIMKEIIARATLD